MPAIALSNVDFPAPLAPTMCVHFPVGNSHEISHNIRRLFSSTEISSRKSESFELSMLPSIVDRCIRYTSASPEIALASRRRARGAAQIYSARLARTRANFSTYSGGFPIAASSDSAMSRRAFADLPSPPSICFEA